MSSSDSKGKSIDKVDSLSVRLENLRSNINNVSKSYIAEQLTALSHDVKESIDELRKELNEKLEIIMKKLGDRDPSPPRPTVNLPPPPPPYGTADMVKLNNRISPPPINPPDINPIPIILPSPPMKPPQPIVQPSPPPLPISPPYDAEALRREMMGELERLKKIMKGN